MEIYDLSIELLSLLIIYINLKKGLFMKKLVKFLCLPIIISFVLPSNYIAAEEQTSRESEIILLSENDRNVNGERLTQYVYETNEGVYIVETFDTMIIVYDTNHNIVATAFFDKIVNRYEEYSIRNNTLISPSALVDDYDKWNGWRSTDMVKFIPKFSTSTISSAVLNTLLSAALSTSGINIISAAISALCGVIAETIVSGQTVYVKGDYNYNKYCDILRKERVNYLNSNGSVKIYGSAVVNWLNTPWDYTTPAACRVLTERY